MISYFQGLPEVPFHALDISDTVDFLAINAARTIQGSGGPRFIWNMESPFRAEGWGNGTTSNDSTASGGDWGNEEIGTVLSS